MSTISSKHTFSYRMSDPLPCVEADSDRVTQVLLNLLTNAIKYSPQGGSIEVIANAEDDHIHVLIRDEGIGIPPQALEKVFDPYNRVHTENTRYIKGTGLGLPIVRQIIELHHGKVWVESVLGKGSIFHFTLPLTAIKQPVTAQASTQTTPHPLE